jgi:DNA-binding PadR family transcriptional regulator
LAESTRHAVLGLVAREPTHGYALYSEIERWPLPDQLRPGRSTVYRHLERLHADGLIAPHAPAADSPASRHPDRTVFAATTAGLTELDRHARTPPRSFDDLCVRVSVARPADLSVLIAFAADLEQLSVTRFQEWSVAPEPLAMARRAAPWRTIMRTLVAKSQAADVAAQATVLGDLRAELEALHALADRDA